MPSLTNEIDTVNGIPDNKNDQINALLLRAWRERWTDAQWSINIKMVRSF